MCYVVFATNSFLILVDRWWLCQMAATEEKQEHCFFLFYISWVCWSNDFTFQIVLLSLDTEVYCTVMESIPCITDKGQDGLLDTKRYTHQSHSAIIAIATGYFMQTQFHCCFTWVLYLLCLEFYILCSPLHKESHRLALKTIKIDVWLWTFWYLYIPRGLITI